MGHPCLVSCHNMAQHAVSFLVVAHQKCQITCNTLFFVLLCEHLGHPSFTHFPIPQMTTDNVIESLISEESAGTDQKFVVTHSFVDLTQQIIVHQRWMPTSHLIVHVLSSFIEHLNPFPKHAITHRIVTIRLTDLVMNLTWQHIPGVQKTNYRPYFTVGGPFNCLKHD